MDQDNAPVDGGGGPTPGQNEAPKIEQLRVEIATKVSKGHNRLFWLVVAFAVVLVVGTGSAICTGKTVETMALAASVQVAFGMVMGFTFVYFGLMMTWFSVDAAYEFRGRSGGSEANLKSASPGLLFALGGIVLIAVSLYKPIVYEETGGFTDVQSIPLADEYGKGNTEIKPNPPPPSGP